jgi:hypothetical protein
LEKATLPIDSRLERAENGAMKYRRLRIAWSAVWAIVCLLFVALWVRSYWTGDTVQGPFRGRLIFNSLLGRATATYYPFRADTTDSVLWTSDWEHLSFPTEDRPRIPGSHSFVLRRDSASIVTSIPYWFAVLIFATLAAAPWFPHRFSVRKLIIATALLSAILGLLVSLDI